MAHSPPLRIDAHVHVFDHRAPLADARRYTPQRSATAEELLRHLDAHRLTHALLVQPSFLGTDNRQLIATLDHHPERFRGVAVVDPSVTDEELADLQAAGVVGARYNLIGADPQVFISPRWQGLTQRLIAAQWHIELHAESAALLSLLPRLLEAGGQVVVDHFGLPTDENDPAQGLLCYLGGSGAPLWVKLSAPYRFRADPAPRAAALCQVLGPERLFWGSDWPWTQHERGRHYGQLLSALSRWLGGCAERVLAAPAALMGLTPKNLAP